MKDMFSKVCDTLKKQLKLCFKMDLYHFIMKFHTLTSQ